MNFIKYIFGFFYIIFSAVFLQFFAFAFTGSSILKEFGFLSSGFLWVECCSLLNVIIFCNVLSWFSGLRRGYPISFFYLVGVYSFFVTLGCLLIGEEWSFKLLIGCFISLFLASAVKILFGACDGEADGLKSIEERIIFYFYFSFACIVFSGWNLMVFLM